jgi:hypothetical protein
LAALAFSLLAAAGCVEESGVLVILQNQIPVADETTRICTPSSEGGGAPRSLGTLDLDVGMPQPYLVYPLVQSRLLPQAAAGGAEPNTVTLNGAKITLIPPSGVNVPWQATCQGSFQSSTALTLDPGQTKAFSIPAMLGCHTAQIRTLFVTGELPSDLGQMVLFTIEMRATGQRSSGDAIESGAFRLPVRVCVGCLQTGFPGLAQFNYPTRPRCADSPKPNPHKGNPCNIAQDYGPLLCCIDSMDQPVCPAPDL